MISLILLGLLNILTLIYLLIKENRSPFLAIFWLGLLTINAILFHQAINALNNQLFTKEEVKLSLYFITASNILLFFYIIIINEYRVNVINEYFSRTPSTQVNKLSLLYAILALVCLILAADGIANLQLRWDYLSVKLDQSKFKYFVYLFSFFSLSYIYINLNTKQKNKTNILLSILIIASIFLILRIKLLLVILLLVIFCAKFQAKTPLKNIVLILLLGGVVYLISMTIRWNGPLSNFNVEHLWGTFKRVLKAGIERRLYIEYQNVFNYYNVHNPLNGQNYLKVLTLPFAKLGLIEPYENTMYTYFQIMQYKNESVTIMKGSSHPTIYGDNFANFRWFGLIILPIFYSLILFLSNIIKKTQHSIQSAFLAIGTILLIILYLRGSTYYAILYFLIFAILSYLTKLKVYLK